MGGLDTMERLIHSSQHHVDESDRRRRKWGLESVKRLGRGDGTCQECSEPSREKNQHPGLHPNGGEVACSRSFSLGSPALSTCLVLLGI